MKLERVFVKEGQDPFDAVKWGRRTCEIKDAKGKTVYRGENLEFPVEWSQTASDICASKYFRKAGVPKKFANFDGDVEKSAEPQESGPETSLRQVVHRMVGCWTHWAKEYGYFDEDKPTLSMAQVQIRERNARIFYDELVYMLLHQMAAPNSPQWFNTGLNWAYGINGPAQGHFYCDHATGKVRVSEDAYTHPQPHACFIQSVKDDLIGPGGIMDLWQREARLFKYGSGTGTNFSSLRSKGEPLNNGGTSGGLMAWLKIGDVAAGAIKSGGTTRRAAKMVCLDADHPEVLDFIDWKAREELKVKAMVEGARCLEGREDWVPSAGLNLHLDYDFNGEAYGTISGQNANNSVRIDGAEFFHAYDTGGTWWLRNRLDKKQVRAVTPREVWDKIAYAAWFCADPGLQFDDIINSWNTCPKDGKINASNPCSEYMFLDDTACNLASLNIMSFLLRNGSRTPAAWSFDINGFHQAVDLWTIVLEVSVAMAQYPSEAIAANSWKYRTLGLGYANLGAAIMSLGLPYDSEPARAFAATLTSLLTGRAYRMSSILAKTMGRTFNGEDMGRVIQGHAFFAGDQRHRLEVSNKHPFVSTEQLRYVALVNGQEMAAASLDAWLQAQNLGMAFGYRNAQVSCIAPTGTIGLVMDCDTTGVEPDFALIKTKKMSGGGVITIVNQSVADALVTLGYPDDDISDMIKEIERGGTLEAAGVKKEHWPVFACAAGDHAIPAMGHVRMMAAVQPFVSGAISKTVNMPTSSTVDDVKEVYRSAWELGLKAIAIYRDGCKQSQPLNVKKEEKLDHEEADRTARAIFKKTYGESVEPEGIVGTVREVASAMIQTSIAKTIENLSRTPQRRSLPKTRNSVTHKFSVAGHSGYVTVGLFEDGTPGEIFIRMNKAGSTVYGLCEALGRAVSMALQYGVPLRRVVDSFSYQRFEPAGMTDDKDIPIAQSIVDYVFRWVGKRFSPDHDAGREAAPVARETEGGGPEVVPGPYDLGDTFPCHGGASGEVGERKGEKTPGPSAQASSIQKDAPACEVCGSIMVRSGSCYKCLNCGNQGGCG